jgi:hypothetical protein
MLQRKSGETVRNNCSINTRPNTLIASEANRTTRCDGSTRSIPSTASSCAAKPTRQSSNAIAPSQPGRGVGRSPSVDFRLHQDQEEEVPATETQAHRPTGYRQETRPARSAQMPGPASPTGHTDCNREKHGTTATTGAPAGSQVQRQEGRKNPRQPVTPGGNHRHLACPSRSDNPRAFATGSALVNS